MFRRYFKLEESLRAITKMDGYSLSPNTFRVLEKAMVHFRNFLSIPVCLQKQGRMLNDARRMFDHVCDDCTMTSEHLANDALIVRNKPFEKAMIKIINGDEKQLYSNKLKAT